MNRTLTMCGALLVVLGGASASSQELPKVPERGRSSIGQPSPDLKQPLLDGGTTGPINVFCGADSRNGSPAMDSAPQTIGLADVLDDVVTLLTGLAWPVTALAVAFLFRSQIAERLSHIKRGKLGSAELVFNFDEELRIAEQEANIPEAPGRAPDVAAVASIAQDPRGAILSAWLDVEAALNYLVEVKHLAEGYSRIGKRPLAAIALVQRKGLLASNYVELFHELYVLRNEAVHVAGAGPAPEAVVRYVRLANELVGEIKKMATVAR